MRELEVIVLAAGKGTRMYSDLPKVLHRVCGQALIERTLRAVSALNPRRIVTVLGYGRERVELEIAHIAAHLDGVALTCVEQAEQLGTGHAARVGMEAIAGDSGAVLIVPGDVPLLRGELLAEFVAAVAAADVALLSCEHPTPFGFGRVVRSADGSVVKVVEERDCTPAERELSEINTSVYLCSKAFLRTALSQLRADNAQGELYLTDIVAYAAAQGVPVSAYRTDDVVAVTGANTRYELSMLEKSRRLQINRELMEHGVTFEDSDSTYIDEQVLIGRDTFIGAGTRIRGATRIGSNVVIEGNSLIEDAEIGSGTVVKLSCYLRQCRVGEKCELGPFAQLRPETILHNGVKIGNFVELKKAELHAGAKANHLSYIGDAEVGAGSNIGAGTIFCNYDGVNKHRAKLEEGVFIGSNSVLVAPVTLGKSAYVAAGSAVTKDVPAGALAVGRSRQSIIEGWVERKNSKRKG